MSSEASPTVEGAGKVRVDVRLGLYFDEGVCDAFMARAKTTGDMPRAAADLILAAVSLVLPARLTLADFSAICRSGYVAVVNDRRDLSDEEKARLIHG